METVIHKAESQGHANHAVKINVPVLVFARYVNPERINFGVLRVLDDDTVASGIGFGTRTYQNMEILQNKFLRYQENVTLRYDQVSSDFSKIVFIKSYHQIKSIPRF